MFKVGDIVRGQGCNIGHLDGAIGKVAREMDYMGTVMVNFEKHGSYYVAHDILQLEKSYIRNNKLNQLLR